MKLIDLHIHLDGAISLKSARQLAAMQNIAVPNDDEELKKLMQVNPDCRNLNDFLSKFDLPCSLIQTPEGMSTAVSNLCEELLGQGLIYAELRFAPSKCCDKGMSQEDAVVAAIEGLKKSEFSAQLILCCMRGDDKETMEETVRIAAKYIHKGVCAIDLAGSESLYHIGQYESIFTMAKELEVPYTIHAGEDDGPESIWKAIKLGAKRIGHGTRAIEDSRLVKYLAEHNIVLEMCPTSNIQTHAVPDEASLPIRNFLDSGIKVTINTDDPSIEGTELKAEWERVKAAFKLTKEEMQEMTINAIEASFLSEKEKKELISKYMHN